MACSNGAAALFAIQELGVLVAGLLIGAVFSFLSPEFLTAASAGSILASAVQFGIVGLGVTVLMIAGEFDLSVASVYSLCPLVMASLWVNHDVNVLPRWRWRCSWRSPSASLNGLATLMLGIPSFIITLATALFWAGVSLNLTGGYPISYFGNSPVMSWLGAAEIGTQQDLGLDPLAGRHRGDPGGGSADDRHRQLGLRQRRRRPRGARDGRAGRRRSSSPASSCPRVLAAFTGIIQFGSFGSATPTQGSDLALTAIVVAVVGGGSLMGGRGSIMGALLAAIVLGMSYTGLVLSGVSTTWFQSFVGFLLLFAVIINLRTEGLGARFGVIRKS